MVPKCCKIGKIYPSEASWQMFYGVDNTTVTWVVGNIRMGNMLPLEIMSESQIFKNPIYFFVNQQRAES